MRSSSDEIGQLACALAKAQAELINPRKTLTATVDGGPEGGKKSYRYASLSEGLKIIRKTLGRHELAIVQTTDIDPVTGTVELTMMLVHGSGEWIATRWPVCPGDACGDPKVMGAALTYARRYSLFALVGVAGEEDLDAPEVKRAPNGHASAGAHRHPRPTLVAPPIPRGRPPRTLSSVGSNGHVRGTGEEVTRATSVTADPLADLAHADSEDALVRWAIAAMPHRNGLDDASRAALDATFRARAQSLGASPDLVLAFADDSEGVFLNAPSSSGDSHEPQASV